MRILVVEDDPATGKALLQGFREAGHNCRLATDGAVALEQAMSQNADVIVLDDPRCIRLMEDFIRARPNLWNEDIAVPPEA